MRVLGLHDGHNTSCAVVQDGRIVAAVDEERHRRLKNFDARRHPRGMPRGALRAVFARAPGPVDLVALPMAAPWEDVARMRRLGHGDAAGWAGVTGLATWKALRIARIRAFLASERVRAPLVLVHHHEAHAASAWMTSGMARGVALTCDGKGDLLSGCAVRFGPEGTQALDELDQFDSPAMIYSLVTALLGLRPDEDEGKVTAMAAAGQRDPAVAATLRGVLAAVDGRPWGVGLRRTRRAGSWMVQSVGDLREALGEALGDLRDPGRQRAVAGEVQALVEEVIVAWVRRTLRRAGEDQLAVAGGLFTNVTLNRRLADLPEVGRLWVHPAMGDAGLAVGAALAAGHRCAGWRGERLTHVFLGDAIRAQPDHEEGLATPERVARALAEGRLVAVARGAMEYGPRALGHRSILARPDRPALAARLNAALRRDDRMPFGPAIRQGADIVRLTEADAANRPFMTLVYAVRPEWRERMAGVVGADGSCRAQIVGPEHRWLHAVLCAFEARTGLPALLNTSFNVHREPIVCSEEDAQRTFRAAGLDALVLGDRWVEAAQRR